MNDGLGNVLLSYKKLKAKLKRDEFEKKVENKEVFEESVSSSNPNGLIVEYNGIRIFIPNSLSAGQKDKVRFRVIEYNPKEHKVIGSCKVLVDEAKAEKEKKFWDEAKEGKEYEGTVASISSYGAFIDINGVQGLLHISEMSWDRDAKANDILKEGQKVKVRIKTLDKENKRIQLAYDGKGVDPWETLSIKVGDVIKVKIKSIKTFGAFATVAPTIDGLIHISQISSEKIAKPEDKLKVGQEVEVKVINVDKENKKVELSIKELEGKKVEGANSNEETASGETILWSSETAAQENNEEVKEEIKENLEGDESAKD
jgi:4-hydroxy-3-methylbut-2-enyl diphosphate reductase